MSPENKTSIVTDTSSDIPKELKRTLGIKEVPIKAYIGGEEINNTDELVSEMKKGIPKDDEHKFTTAAPSPEAIVDVYKKLPSKKIVSVHLTQNMSATFNNAQTAAEQLMKEDKEFEIVTFQSRVSMGLGFLAIEAAKNADKTPAEILEIIQEKSQRTFLACAFDTLEYVYRGGRLPKEQYLLGKALHVKPVFVVDSGFEVESKPKGRKKSLKKLLEVAEENAPFEELAIIHTCSDEEIEEVSSGIKRFYNGEQIISQVGPVVATYGGSGVIGVCGAKKN